MDACVPPIVCRLFCLFACCRRSHPAGGSSNNKWLLELCPLLRRLWALARHCRQGTPSVHKACAQLVDSLKQVWQANKPTSRKDQCHSLDSIEMLKIGNWVIYIWDRVSKCQQHEFYSSNLASLRSTTTTPGPINGHATATQIVLCCCLFVPFKCSHQCHDQWLHLFSSLLIASDGSHCSNSAACLLLQVNHLKAFV